MTRITIVADTVSVVITGDRPDLGPVFEKFENWEGVDNVDTGMVKRPGAPGAFGPTQTFPDDLVISIEGKSLNSPFGRSRADAARIREDLTSLYNDGRPVLALVEDDLRTTQREVLIASVKLPWTAQPDFPFSIDMTAADPRRYGAVEVVSTGLAIPGSGLQLPYDEASGIGLLLPSDETTGLGIDFGSTTVSGTVVAVNEGTTETISTYTVSGGSMPDGFVIGNVATGERLTYLGAVAEGATVTIDSGTRTAFINGTTPGGRWLASPQWWSIPPRSSVEVSFLARGVYTGTPRLFIATAPAFY